MNTELLTNKQTQTLSLLLKFRFTTVYQLQKYFNYKDPRRVREWLEDLRSKKYIDRIKDKDVTKPIVYCLAQKSRKLFIKNKNIDRDFLDRMYKEKSKSKLFKQHWLFLFDTYLYFFINKDKESKLTFCTEQDLKAFDYFPEDLDAYMAVKTKNGTKRYFLELFDEYRKPAGVARFAIRKYITYSEEGSWQANTKNSPFPTLLFVVQDERRRKHLHMYGKAKLAKTFEDISLFLTTQDAIRFSKGKINIWKKVD